MIIKNAADLKAAILDAESRKAREKELLVEDFYELKESLKPVNLIKSTFNKVKETPGIGSTVLKAAVGMGAGFLSKRLFLGKSPGFFKKILGSALEVGIAGFVAKKTDGIKFNGIQVMKKIFTSKDKPGGK